ncbi:metal transporter [Streptomyces sp. ME19-01-6]|uniref:metal transporter n=1 Tax=Streptomyces sp. ME19-01-6 TaxID=3028686 RepID=UPI0029B07498|nr:metal transporter [Streptomyces sp. ME19-01-6]MDX3226487.1 metal transporter [Streptomyces sp. ME19-01-6]
MDTGNTAGRTRPGGGAVNAGLGAVFALGIAFTAFMLIRSWGGASWVFTTGVGVGVCSLALLRERQRARTAVAGSAVAAAAVTVSGLADLPQEPSPATALGLSVLIGSAIRTLPPAQAGGIALAGLAVVAGAWIFGAGAIPVLATLAWIAALVTGVGLRTLGKGHRGPAERHGR